MPHMGIWPPLLLLPVVVEVQSPPENCREKVLKLTHYGLHLDHLPDAPKGFLQVNLPLHTPRRVILARASLGTDGRGGN